MSPEWDAAYLNAEFTGIETLLENEIFYSLNIIEQKLLKSFLIFKFVVEVIIKID